MPYEKREVNPAARNILCPCYSVCLTAAARGNSTGFSCTECAHRTDHAPIPSGEVYAAGALLARVFFGELSFRISATCPRCGLRYERYTIENGSPRRLCPSCVSFAASTWAAGSPEHRFALRDRARVTFQATPRVLREELST